MSMTREEIIKAYEDAVVASGLAAAAGNEEAAKFYELFKAGLSALRAVSRERIEKVWRGYWIHEEIQSNQSTTGYFKISSCECSKCGCYVQQEANFCPYCGAAQTDEAVEITMKRL